MGNRIHEIINEERYKRGLPWVMWSRQMARYAQDQADYCAAKGKLIHSNRPAFEGGENLAQGGDRFPARAVVNCWLGSKGHREYILSRQVTKAGVGIVKARGRTYVAWSFSDRYPSYPDCPGCYSNVVDTLKDAFSNKWVIVVIVILLVLFAIIIKFGIIDYL